MLDSKAAFRFMLQTGDSRLPEMSGNEQATLICHTNCIAIQKALALFVSTAQKVLEHFVWQC
jgi:hypothetical protein